MRKVIFGLAAGTMLALGSTSANATTYIGTTTGCFGPACAPILATQTYGGLTFNSGSFNQADSNGFLGIGSGAPPTDTFGLFNLTGLNFNYNSPPTLFTLLITFTNPTGTAGANSFGSTITGTVSGDNAGGVHIDFDNTAHFFTSSAGPFTVTLNDFDVSAGSLGTPITGRINALAVPEPATWGMMLLGFAGIGMAMRRRRRPALAQLA
jgi:hypothetical protein